MRAACEASLRALETDRIDLYQFHRPDPKVPYEESIGAIKELQDEGKVRWVGISNANVEQIELACSIVDIVSVQNQLSLEYTVADRQGRGGGCARSAGSRSCRGRRSAGSANAGRGGGQRTTRCSAAADAHGVSPQQVALAWLLSLSPVDGPDPGREPPGVDPGLGAGGRAGADRRRAGGDRMRQRTSSSRPTATGRCSCAGRCAWSTRTATRSPSTARRSRSAVAASRGCGRSATGRTSWCASVRRAGRRTVARPTPGYVRLGRLRSAP